MFRSEFDDAGILKRPTIIIEDNQMILTKTQAALLVVALAIGAFLYYLMFKHLLKKDEIGSLFLWSFLGSFFLGALIFGAIDFAKRLIHYRREKLSCKYGNVKAGDCISKWSK